MIDPPAPRRLPLWLMFMTSALLVYAGITLVETLSSLRTPRSDTAATLEEVARSSGQVDAVAHLRVLGDTLAAQHQRGLRLDALVVIVVALLILYAVAAILLRDRHARRLALLAGWVGLASQFVRLPFELRLARQLTAQGVPVLQRFLTQSGMQVPGMPQDHAAALHTTIIMMPVMRAAVGIAWSLALLVFFGGRRARDLLGPPAPPTPPPAELR